MTGMRPCLRGTDGGEAEQLVEHHRTAPIANIGQCLPACTLRRNIAKQGCAIADRFGQACLDIGVNLLRGLTAPVSDYGTEPLREILSGRRLVAQSGEI